MRFVNIVYPQARVAKLYCRDPSKNIFSRAPCGRWQVLNFKCKGKFVFTVPNFGGENWKFSIFSPSLSPQTMICKLKDILKSWGWLIRRKFIFYEISREGRQPHPKCLPHRQTITALALHSPNCTSSIAPSQLPGIHSKFPHVI